MISRCLIAIMLLSVFTASVADAQQPMLHSTMTRSGMDARLLAVTPNGKRLIVASSSGLDIWDLASGQQVSNPLRTSVDALAVHPNGRQAVAAQNYRNELQWVDLETGKKGKKWKSTAEESFAGLAFSPDGALLAVDQRNSVTLWDVVTGKPGRTIQYAQASASICGLAFTSDGKTLATGATGDARLQLWNTADGSLLKTIKGNAGYLKSVCFTGDDKQLVTGHGDAIARVWDATTGELQASFKSSEREVSVPNFMAAVSPDGRLVAAAGIDKAARVWNIATGEQVAALPGQHAKADAQQAVFLPDGKGAVVGFDRCAFTPGQPMVMVWEISSRK